jgi:hypothetical protein
MSDVTVNYSASIDVPAPRATVEDLQRAMAAMPQYVPDTEHFFADGMYCRLVRRAKDVVIVGKVHKKEHFYMVVHGAVAVIQDGAEKRIYRAPSVIVSKPGTKRAVVALEDSVCLTVHRTDNTDLDEIESELVEDDPTAMFGSGNLLKALEHQP